MAKRYFSILGFLKRAANWRVFEIKPSFPRCFPELDLFETEKERNAAWEKAATWRMHWTDILLYVVMTGSMYLVAFLALRVLGLAAAPYATVIAGAVLGLGVVLLSPFLRRRQIRRLLREQLLASGIPVCRRCGYALRGLTEPRCPECGERFDEKLLDLLTEEGAERSEPRSGDD